MATHTIYPPQPVIQATGHSDLVRLAETYQVTVKSGKNRYVITINKGFTCDGATIPRLLWPVIGHPLSSQTVPAAIIHDSLYSSHWLPRHVADRIFYNLLVQAGHSRLAAATMYAAVRVAGAIAWSKPPEQVRSARFQVGVAVLSK